MLDSEGLHMRAAFFRCIRSFFYHQGFLEVDTPLRQPVYIPESNIIPLASENQYLQSSPELCMKRLLAAGHDRIFQICPCFRKEERGRLHLEEFQMLEWYRQGVDYQQLMADCELLLRSLLIDLWEFRLDAGMVGKKILAAIDIDQDWQRLTVAEAFASYAPMQLEQALQQGKFDELLVEYIEPRLGQVAPTFLCDYPAELGSLARKKIDNPAVVERFELYINGVEIANGFSELTDAAEQRARFVEEIALLQSARGKEAVLPERFLAALEQLDTAAGIALGLDRLFMQLMNYPRITEAVTFSPDDFL